MAERVPRGHWLPGLCAVLNQPLIVLDQATGRGFACTMSGVGHIFQLHALLADRLIGNPGEGLSPGAPPLASLVLAATTGPARLPYDHSIRRRFRLYDGAGQYIYAEGIPADIPVFDGSLVIVLLPPGPTAYGWTNGRTYEGMIPNFTLDRILTAAETETWSRRTIPPRDDQGAFGH